jgi:hypothetical protein
MIIASLSGCIPAAMRIFQAAGSFEHSVLRDESLNTSYFASKLFRLL